MQSTVQDCIFRSVTAYRTNRNSPGLSATLWLLDPVFIEDHQLHKAGPAAVTPRSLSTFEQTSSFSGACPLESFPWPRTVRNHHRMQAGV